MGLFESIKGGFFESGHTILILLFFLCCEVGDEVLGVHWIVYSNEEHICELLPKVAPIKSEGFGRRGEDQVAFTLLWQHGTLHEAAEFSIMVSFLVIAVDQLLNLLFGRQL